jgi:hypothetical protein
MLVVEIGGIICRSVVLSLCNNRLVHELLLMILLYSMILILVVFHPLLSSLNHWIIQLGRLLIVIVIVIVIVVSFGGNLVHTTYWSTYYTVIVYCIHMFRAAVALFIHRVFTWNIITHIIILLPSVSQLIAIAIAITATLLLEIVLPHRI